MKWFKHMSDASEDIKVMKVEEQFGLVGYAAYWKITEYCARQWKVGTPCEFEITWKHCQNILRMKRKQTQIILRLFSDLNLFEVLISETTITIKYPKLALIKDEHSRKMSHNSGVTPEKVPLDIDTEREGEVYKKGGVGEKAEKAPSGFQPTDLVTLWNNNYYPSIGRGKCDKLSDKRKRVVTMALKNYPAKEDWDLIFSEITNTDWISGEKRAQDGNKFPFDFDSIFEKERYLKAYESASARHETDIDLDAILNFRPKESM